ncbi:MAG TPA: uroporphyrinogen decarboxylase family protein [Candidatus Bathyarchaeia archaeon]|nr:uroporphyrinogen decarboxylase family protein [Candidatus Bathyarchaeia archaeon]
MGTHMTSRERFLKTMRYEKVDRVPYFEEGIRKDVIKAWRTQGLTRKAELSEMFSTDRREEIEVDLEPRPELKKWPSSRNELDVLRKSLDPNDSSRLPWKWSRQVRTWRSRDHILMLRVHRGFFLSMGVYGWDRFSEVVRLLIKDPKFVRKALAIQGEFAARMAEKVLNEVEIDAAVFSEPIGGNDRPLISPKMYEEFVLTSYQPVLDVLNRYGVGTIILRTFANTRILIPRILKCGFNCLWACEVNIDAMDYRNLRREFGTDLRLIGGIDLDALRRDKEAIRYEVEEKVPPLLAGGGYIPLADGRVRADVPFENYVYYRKLMEKVTRA